MGPSPQPHIHRRTTHQPCNQRGCSTHLALTCRHRLVDLYNSSCSATESHLTTIQITRATDVLPEEEIAAVQPLVDEINRLKIERNAIVAAHNYMTPDIFHLVADITGDSLALANLALEADADVIVLAGVKFMAETAKIINPEKTILIPDLAAGCSLADGITGADVRRMKAQYPGLPVVSYVNTSAEVKAESEITCTSGNALAVVESLGVDRVIFTPDQYLGKWVASKTDVEVILWEGSCMVHERFTGEEISDYKRDMGDIPVIAHPECPPDVLAEADYVGSTHGMIKWVSDNRPRKVMMITECSMADNIASAAPDTEFVRPCNLCPHMKRITLDNIKHSLETLTYQVEIPQDVAERARRAVTRMLEVGRQD
ncbi:MAG: quinolinate synthase NadA [Actinobacteria bacterium]|nr:quinolinate synthase NadA [Actinomycetota bacterium]